MAPTKRALAGEIGRSLRAQTGLEVFGPNGLQARLVVVVNGAAPTKGTWRKNDIALDITGGWWICTVAGSPGTWKADGAPGGFTDPTTTIGDLIVRLQTGLDRLAIGAVGTVLQVRSLGNFAAQLLNMNPYLWYRLNEASGTTMADSSQTGAHPGVYAGSGVTYHVAPMLGDGDYGVTFDGATGTAHVSADPTGTGDFSMACFVKTTTTGEKYAVATFNYAGGTFAANNAWGFSPCGVYAGPNRPSFAVSTGAISVAAIQTSALTINDNNWHFVVVTREKAGGNTIMYIDGAVAASGVILAGTAINGGTAMYLGSDAGGGHLLPGSVDEVATWQRVLSPAEVSTLWTNVSTPANGVPAWGPSPGILASIGVAEGDMLYYHSGLWTRLPVGGANTLLHGGTDPGYSAVVEGDISLSDVATDNVSITKHGFAPKAPNDATKFLDGTGAYSVPGGSGFANPMTTLDDIIIGGTAGAATRLAKGSNGYVLTVDSSTGHVVWAAAASGFADPTTTKGDLIVHGTSTTRLPVGSDGQVLVADSTQTLGVKWGGDASWTNVTYQNSWASFGSGYPAVGYRKDASGYVHLRGLAAGGTGTDGTVVFTLPAGYRPGALVYASGRGASGVFQAFNIATDGTVKISGNLASNSLLGFDGITFLAEN